MFSELMTTEANISDMARTIGENLRTVAGLDGLTDNEKIMLLKSVVFDMKKDSLKKEIAIHAVDYDSAKADFLTQKAAKSKHTAARYARALTVFEAYCNERGICPFEVRTAAARDFAHAYLATVNEGTYSPATRRSIVDAVSSFFNFSEALFEEVGMTLANPFRHVEKVKKQSTRALCFPKSRDEVNTMISAFSPVLACITYIMATTGLRIGAFSGMQISGREYRTTSKGKQVRGKLDSTAAKMIKALCAENPEQPFADCDTVKLKNLFKYYTKRLFKEGRIRAAYSPHDIRHYYAYTEYAKDKDIYRVKQLLNHADIRITEVYLREIDAITE